MVRIDLESAFNPILYEALNLLGSSAWDSRLLDDNLGRGGDLGDTSGSELEVADVS